MSLNQKLETYNQHFGFKENTKDSNFNLSPERIIYKNEALRNHDRDLYAGYLADTYPNEMEHELTDFDNAVGSIVKMSKEEVQAYMNEKGYNMLQADLSYADEDAIFSFRTVSEDNLSWELENNAEDLLQAKALLSDAFSTEKPWIYVVKK